MHNAARSLHSDGPQCVGKGSRSMHQVIREFLTVTPIATVLQLALYWHTDRFGKGK